MIQANVSSTQTMVVQRATEIRFKELTLFTENLGVVASLAAFLAETSIESLYIEPETVSKSHGHNDFSTLCWSLSAVTISLNMLTLLVSMYTMLYGPALAIRGPAGSMSIAVSRIFVQRRLALRLFYGGLLCKVVQTMCLAAWRYPWQIATPCVMVFVVFLFATYNCIMRVTRKFGFKQFGIHRHDFIEISGVASLGHATRTYAANNHHHNSQSPSGNLGSSMNNASRSSNGGHEDHVATSTTRVRGGDPECAGWMMKQSAYLKQWTSRWFRIRDQRLEWSMGSGATIRGSLKLGNGHIIHVEPVEVNKPGVFSYGLVISVRDLQSRTISELHVAIDSTESRDHWTEAIMRAANTPKEFNESDTRRGSVLSRYIPHMSPMTGNMTPTRSTRAVSS